MKTNKKASKRPWKMSFRSMPDAILAKINNLTSDDFIIACVRKVPASEIEAGKYAHLGIVMKDGVPDFPAEQIPDVRNGKYSRINAHGKELVLKDEPKVLKTYSVETPNWGDWSNGSHTVEWDRQVYRRTWFAPRELSLGIEIIGKDVNAEDTYLIKFSVKDVLNRKSSRFRKTAQLENDVFFDVNLLQENVGAANAFSSDATRDDYLKTIYVAWEILPPGERDETVARILSVYKSPTEELRTKVEARYTLLMKLKPEVLIAGASGFRRYFGAKFSDSLVVFENLEYGNAIYAMFENWETLSKMSRVELLKGMSNGFRRIVHSSGWEERLKEVVRDRLRPAA